MYADSLIFLCKFLKSPRQIGSVTPSSSWLVRAMLEHVDWRGTKSLVELGAGTGVVTKQIYRQTKPGTQVFVFEQDRDLRRNLSRRFTNFNFYDQAEAVRQTISTHGLKSVDCIVSSLPFANFTEETREKILDNITRSLHSEGMFITYQYSLQMKKKLQEKFESVSIRFVPLNIPPAFVYCCRKAKGV